MLKKPTIYLAIFSLSIFSTVAQDDAEFERYLREQQAEFQEFQNKREQEFQAFVERWKKAEQAYKNEIAEKWEDAKLPDKKRWVEYSEDKSRRTIVDYENNTITVEVLGEADDSDVLGTAKSEIKRLNETSAEEAAESDPIIINAGMAVNNRSQRQPRRSESLLGYNVDEQKMSPQKVRRSGNRASVTVKMPEAAVSERVKRVLPAAETYALQWGLPTELVIAVIHTESSFNPLARSHIPAFGLMQIVPTSAGKDITQFLHGQQRLLSPEYLFDPNRNIQAGSVYFHLLLNRYFKNVRNSQSRFYMAIAAYNTGPGNVARAMANTTSLKKASKAANQMSPAQVYQHLMTYLPATETKNYLTKVTEREAHYQQALGL